MTDEQTPTPEPTQSTEAKPAPEVAQAPQAKQRPVETLRDGLIRASIWERSSDKGSMFNTTLSRSYQDNEGNWKDTNSLRSRDNLPASELLRQSHSRINELKAERAAQRSEQAQSRDQDQGQER